MALKFDWDPRKARNNVDKHGISFIEAATVFSDPLSMTYNDPDHSLDETRLITIGLSHSSKSLMVSHTEATDHIRIISARKLTKNERQQYEKKHR